MGIAKIVVPLDGSDLSKRILTAVVRLAVATSAEVRAIRVLDGYEADQALLRGEDPHALATADLRATLEPLAKLGLRISWDSYGGDIASRIIDDATERKASLIAMSTHGRSGVERWVRGSVAERVLRHSPVPVFLMNPQTIGDAHAPPMRRILVPLDGSELAAAALPLAGEFARIHDAEIVLLHVVERGLDPFSARPTDAALDLLARFANRLGATRVKTVVKAGAPALGILQAAESEKVDLIAMSTHGRSGVSRWALGSTAEDVLRHAPTPLLVVRSPGSGAEA